jgi:hypothetical protein
LAGVAPDRAARWPRGPTWADGRPTVGPLTSFSPGRQETLAIGQAVCCGEVVRWTPPWRPALTTKGSAAVRRRPAAVRSASPRAHVVRRSLPLPPIGFSPVLRYPVRRKRRSLNVNARPTCCQRARPCTLPHSQASPGPTPYTESPESTGSPSEGRSCVSWVSCVRGLRQRGLTR